MAIEITRICDRKDNVEKIKVQVMLDFNFDLDAWREGFLQGKVFEDKKDLERHEKLALDGPSNDDLIHLLRAWIFDGDVDGFVSSLPSAMQELWCTRSFDQFLTDELEDPTIDRFVNGLPAVERLREEAIV